MLTAEIIQGDALQELQKLKAGSVHCCVTSPPYWGLRDYGISGQLGLEKTPEEYVGKMVEVFREVRRVLRENGTLWLNLGDSYVGSGKASGRTWENGNIPNMSRKQVSNFGSLIGKMRDPDGLKPKDLCGIPWRVAFALQQPYYTGTIKDERDRIWLAAMIDAEGCMFIHKRNAGSDSGARFIRKDGIESKYARTQDTYGAGLEVANCHESIVRRCMEITGMGSICSQGPDQNTRRKQKIFRWNLRTSICREIIREIYPHLVGKKHEARILLGCPTSGPEAAKAHSALKSLHNGMEVEIDYAEPKSMFEPGWYLRQEIIWSKANPMPESVRDRCTKAHEQIFMLSKSSRYYYDAEAIKEPAQTEPHNSGYVNGSEYAVGPMDRGGNSQREDPERVWALNGLRNKRSVWTVNPQPYSEAHFATFPPDLIKPCILAGTSAQGCCPKCGAPWERITEDTAGYAAFKANEKERKGGSMRSSSIECLGLTRGSGNKSVTRETKMVGWQPTCDCGEEKTIPCTVLDPFAGSGTTGMVSLELGRKSILIELNPKYVDLIRSRTNVTPGLALA